MLQTLQNLLYSLLNSVRDLAPIVIVVAFFQLVVLKQPFPDLMQMIVGLSLVLLGLTFFINGLEMGLFPIGESMAADFAGKGSVFWLVAFAFALGFGTTGASTGTDEMACVAQGCRRCAADPGTCPRRAFDTGAPTGESFNGRDSG